jgi:Acyclic terpene utilisation family protein AtuA
MDFKCYCVGPIPGYGFNEDSLRMAMTMKPQLLAAQGTSSDIGPSYLGTSQLLTSPEATERDLRLMITTAVQHGIPFVVSLGGAGNDSQLQQSLEIVERVAKRLPRRLRIATVSGEIDKQYLKHKLADGVTMPSLAGSPRIAAQLTPEMVDESACIVAQAGPEVIQQALRLDVDGVVAGRTLDSGLFSASPLTLGFAPANARGFGMLLNDGGASASPQTIDGMFGTLGDDHFDLVPTNPKLRCTPESVMAAAIRERDNPAQEAGPGGILGYEKVEIEQLPDGRTVRVSGFTWTPTPYMVKLEGVKRRGFRSIVIGGIHDPVNIANYERILDGMRTRVAQLLALAPSQYELDCISYGLDGVLGRRDPFRNSAQPHEIGLVLDIVADSQAQADSIAKLARSSVLHSSYPERKSTEGNVAMPFAPTEIPVGPVFVWSIYHGLPLEDPLEPFKIDTIELGPGR